MNPRPRHYEKWEGTSRPPEGTNTTYIGSASERHGNTRGDTLNSSAHSSSDDRHEGPFSVIVCGATHARHCIYGLVDPAEPNRVHYVGQATNPASRLSTHIRHGDHPMGRRAEWIQGLLNAGRAPDMVLLEFVPPGASKEEIDTLEGTWINRMRLIGQAELNALVPTTAGPHVRPWTRADTVGGLARAVVANA